MNPSIKVSTLAIGTELMTGMIADTNAQFVSQELSACGYQVEAHYAVGDYLDEMVEKLKALKTPINLISGGLGPTFDDRTREAAAKAFGQPLEFHESIWQDIRKRYPKLNDSNKLQAYFPQTATILHNSTGTAPAFRMEQNQQVFFFLPGVPSELKTLFREQVEPWIRTHYPLSHFMESCLLKVAGLPESEVAKRLEPILKADDIHSGIFAGEGIITIKLTAIGTDLTRIRQKLQEQETQVRQLFGNALFGNGNQTLPQVILERLSQQQQTLATAESCTGGMVGAEITSVPGSSKSYTQGLITYSNEAKMEYLNVKQTTLEKYGAVSEETAREMAEGLRKRAKTTYAVSVTGIAGPDGGTPEKPVGMVCFGVSGPHGTTSYTRNFYGTRDSIRKRATTAALLLLYLKIIEDSSPKPP